MIEFHERGSGLARMRVQLQTLPRRGIAAGRRGLYRAGWLVMGVSAIRVPVRSGALRATGYVSRPKSKGDTDVVTLGYGGIPGAEGQTVPTSAPHVSARGNVYQQSAGVDYAIYVHENLEAHHAPPTGAKFLEGPATEVAPGAIPVEVDKEMQVELLKMEAEGR